MIYVTKGGRLDTHFHHALIISIGPCAIQSDNLIQVDGGDLSQVFNMLTKAKGWLDRLDGTLALCDTDQEVIDHASAHMELPMFYLDESYRILAITKNVVFANDPEWVHMTENGYLSPRSARLMKESGDLDLLAAAQGPVIYDSPIYPFSSIVCNVLLEGSFVSRLNILCTDGKISPLMLQACEIIVAHLSRILTRNGKLSAGSPLQSILTDLLHGIPLPEELISDRLKTTPYLSGGLLQVFLADVKARTDRQIAPYYAGLLKQLFPAENLLPLVFGEQLVLLAHADNEPGFNNLTVELSHFCAVHHLRCGVSNHFHRMVDLRGYYDQAAAALQSGTEEGLYFYHNVMLDHMLSYISAEQAEFLISPDIRRLEDAADGYSFSLTETLKAYLECNCNLIRTAERLFLHKNTLLYRLNHIKNIIRCDLNDADDRLLLLLSFKLLERVN